MSRLLPKSDSKKEKIFGNNVWIIAKVWPSNSKKENLISIGQFAASNDAPVRSHSDRVKGFKIKVKANSFWSPARDQWALGQCHWLFDVMKIQQTMRNNKHTKTQQTNIEMR